MSPDTIGLIILLGNPVAMVLLGVWSIRLGKQTGRQFFLIVGILSCLAAPIVILAAILILAF